MPLNLIALNTMFFILSIFKDTLEKNLLIFQLLFSYWLLFCRRRIPQKLLLAFWKLQLVEVSLLEIVISILGFFTLFRKIYKVFVNVWNCLEAKNRTVRLRFRSISIGSIKYGNGVFRTEWFHHSYAWILKGIQNQIKQSKISLIFKCAWSYTWAIW